MEAMDFTLESGNLNRVRGVFLIKSNFWKKSYRGIGYFTNVFLLH
jgi:hypothetical protein